MTDAKQWQLIALGHIIIMITTHGPSTVSQRSSNEVDANQNTSFKENQIESMQEEKNGHQSTKYKIEK